MKTRASSATRLLAPALLASGFLVSGALVEDAHAQTPGSASGGTLSGDPGMQGDEFTATDDFPSRSDFGSSRQQSTSELDGRYIVHPVTSPNYHDDAYITTDVRATYINQQFPSTAPFNGGSARVYDLQARYALRSDLQIAVTKAGFQDVHFGPTEEYGGTDVAVAVKYAPLQDWENDRHVAVGVGYEVGTGDPDVFRFGGDDELRFFAAYSGAYEQLNYGVMANALFSTDRQDAAGDSDRVSVHAHFDYTVNELFSPLAELNYYTVIDEGSPVTSFSGLDLANLGGNDGEDVLTFGIGGEFRPLADLAIRAAYETPVTSNTDLFGDRWTVSAIWRF